MSKISEFESAIQLKMSPDLLRWFTSYAPKNDRLKLKFEVNQGVYYFDQDDLDSFNRHLNSPWPMPPKGTRPHIPEGIQQEIKKEAGHCCPVCRTNAGELAHIEPVHKTLNNHPHNLIYLCPNHHTVYDYGRKYQNVSKDDIYAYKKSLLTFQIAQWKLQGNLIDSYIAAINLIGRIQIAEDEILKCINSIDFENLFRSIISKVSDLKAVGNQSHSTTEFLNELDEKPYHTSKEKAYNYHKAKSDFVFLLKKETGLLDCKLCEGKGFTDHYETCPACLGEGLLTKVQIRKIDFSIYDLVDCELCQGNGYTNHFDNCPVCGGEKVLSKEQVQKIDFSIYDLVDCELCQGNGYTNHFDTCPVCSGEKVLSREQVQKIDFSIYDLVDCELCQGNGYTKHFDTCPACVGEKLLSKEQVQKIDFSTYDMVDCKLCEGNGYTDHYAICPACNGETLLSKEQIRNINFDDY